MSRAFLVLGVVAEAVLNASWFGLDSDTSTGAAWLGIVSLLPRAYRLTDMLLDRWMWSTPGATSLGDDSA